MKRLEPCPFCGNIPIFEFVHVDYPVTNFDKYYRLGCKECHKSICYTIRNMMDEKELAKAKETLADEWNERVKNKEKMCW